MKIAILGSGGREHALTFSISKSNKIMYKKRFFLYINNIFQIGFKIENIYYG